MRYNPNIYVGLTDEQVKIRQEEKLVNYDTDIKTISIKGEKILILLAPTIFPNALPKVKFKIINVAILKINDIIE